MIFEIMALILAYIGGFTLLLWGILSIAVYIQERMMK